MAEKWKIMTCKWICKF